MKLDELFNTTEKRNLIIASFKTLKDTQGWILLTDIIKANIKELEEQILNGFEDETKDQIDRKRDKLKAYKEVIETPNYWISRFEFRPEIIDDSDPYATINNIDNSN
jgi:hypothetical protein